MGFGYGYLSLCHPPPLTAAAFSRLAYLAATNPFYGGALVSAAPHLPFQGMVGSPFSPSGTMMSEMDQPLLDQTRGGLTGTEPDMDGTPFSPPGRMMSVVVQPSFETQGGLTDLFKPARITMNGLRDGILGASFTPTGKMMNGLADDGETRGRCYNLKKTEDALYMTLEMPGVGKESVKVYLDGSYLVVKGARELDNVLEEGDDESRPKSYSTRVNLMPVHSYKIDEIKAEMKNGILKVQIPKITNEERTDVLHVQVD